MNKLIVLSCRAGYQLVQDPARQSIKTERASLCSTLFTVTWGKANAKLQDKICLLRTVALHFIVQTYREQCPSRTLQFLLSLVGLLGNNNSLASQSVSLTFDGPAAHDAKADWEMHKQ